MKIVFMGTPEFAVPCLEKILSCGHEVAAVITQRDKPKGRGHKTCPPPVKECAVKNNIAVYQPQTFKNNEAIFELLTDIAPDVIVVVAYGKLLPERILNIPKKGCINVHASILPKYRGAGPIQWAVINGESKTGVTTIFMEKGIDTGDMLLVGELAIGVDETAGELHDRISLLGADILGKTLDNLSSIPRIKQNDTASTYAPMLTKELGEIDWSKSAKEIKNLVRGLNPWPVAYSFYSGEQFKIYGVQICAESYSEKYSCGEIIDSQNAKDMIVKCFDGAIAIKTVHFKDSKKMAIEAYRSGHAILSGIILGR